MSFRSSPYIDFNSGEVKKPPMELIRGLGPRTDQPIDVMLTMFECRVEVWQFGPAVAMLKLMEAERPETSTWAHSGYALLASMFSYFEMIGKILSPTSKARGTSGPDFNHGFCDVYPSFATTTARTDDALPIVAQFRDRVRNGMFHLGYTKSHLYIHHAPHQFPEDFVTQMQGTERYYFVNPHNMTRTLVAHFPGFMERLRNAPPDSGLSQQFVEFYVTCHQGKA